MGGRHAGYQEADVSALLAQGSLVKIASGIGDAAIHIHQRDAALYIARLAPGEAVTLPEAPHVHVYAARGAAEVEGGHAIIAGDALRMIDEPGRVLHAAAQSEIVLWATA